MSRVEYIFQYMNSMTDDELRAEMKAENLEISGGRSKWLRTLREHYRNSLIQIRKNSSKQRTENFYKYFIVIDFECSCEENNYDYEHEIIEFPAVLVSTKTKKIVDSFHTFVKPEINLTEFCSKLTGITQNMVDKAPKFPDALEEFRTWMAKHGLDGKGTGNAKKFCYVTDGPWDIGKFLQMQCKKSRIAIPHDLRPFLNIRRAFVNFYCHSRRGHENQKKLTNIELKTMLAYLGMEFEGKEHCGMDDTINISRILLRMMADGAELRANEKLVLGEKRREWQKLVFDEGKNAPSQILASESTSSEDLELHNCFKENLHIADGEEERGTIKRNEENVIIWKKWWDHLPYKLVKISKIEFLGDQYAECESCDEEDYDDVGG